MMGGGRAGRRRSTSEWAYGGGGAVLALDGHAATEVEGLEAEFVILFLQQIERIHGLVQLENDAPRRVLVHAQPLRAARHHKMRAVRRDRQRRRPRLRLGNRVQVGVHLEAEREALWCCAAAMERAGRAALGPRVARQGTGCGALEKSPSLAQYSMTPRVSVDTTAAWAVLSCMCNTGAVWWRSV